MSVNRSPVPWSLYQFVSGYILMSKWKGGQSALHLSHGLSVSPGQVITGGHHERAFTAQCVEVYRQYGNQRLACIARGTRDVGGC